MLKAYIPMNFRHIFYHKAYYESELQFLELRQVYFESP